MNDGRNKPADRRVVLLVDNRNRDLAGATLIAHQLKKNGVDCFLEPLESYKGCLAAYRPDMIVFNHLMGSHLVAYSNRLAALGVKVAVLPGEGIMYNKEALRFNAGKFHRDAHIDCFFCWNEEHRMAIRETGFQGDVRLEVIGPPRFDFYFTPWSRIFRSRVDFEKNKPVILVCTNFVFAQYKEAAREVADKLFAPWKDRVSAYKDYWGAIEVNHRSRKRFFDYLDAIVKSSRFNVILRPHPSENVKVYQDWYERVPAEGRTAVRLDRESNITELILACDLEVSCETCTTALESWIAGKPTVELTFEKHPMFYHDFIASLNAECADPGEIVSVIEEQLNHQPPADVRERRKEHLARWCNAPCGDSSEQMAVAIAETLADRKAIDWSGLTLDEHRKGIKLKMLRAMGLPYSFDPLLFAKKRIFPEKYITKDRVYRKTITPDDVRRAAFELESSLSARSGL